MYTLLISPLAKEDFGHPATERYTRRLLKGLAIIQDFPLMGRPLSNIIDLPTDYMCLIMDGYYMFYRLEEKTIRIIRVLDIRQDYMSLLFGKR